MSPQNYETIKEMEQMKLMAMMQQRIEKLETYSKEIIEYLQQVPAHSQNVAVYDIDDTLISSKTQKLIYPIYKTAVYAKLRGFSVILITSRKGSLENIQKTRLQLKLLGIKYDKIYFLPHTFSQTEKRIKEFKKTARKHIHKNGQNVVISVGDMYWDIGEYGGVGFHLV